MSQPKRYDHRRDFNGMMVEKDGAWIKHSDYAALAAENKNLLFESERARMDWEMLAAFMFDEKLEDRFKSWHHANYDVWYRRSDVPKWRKANVGKDSSLFEKNAALAAENEVLRKKVDWLMKADRLVIWNGTEWQVRHVVEEPIKPRE